MTLEGRLWSLSVTEKSTYPSLDKHVLTLWPNFWCRYRSYIIHDAASVGSSKHEDEGRLFPLRVRVLLRRLLSKYLTRVKRRSSKIDSFRQLIDKDGQTAGLAHGSCHQFPVPVFPPQKRPLPANVDEREYYPEYSTTSLLRGGRVGSVIAHFCFWAAVFTYLLDARRVCS